ncbi:MAG TPA: hypothetical protein VE954_26890 [Oligoflexus sp.]|uniref:hypothetical protein n=1 Tax=Oligoflexus sp. TaxID=1971216 RepID=UPI002D6C2344|nr:hypothetical protein [Oligoflexus sp.]HYX36751.1 hypothetical protein [Oligoflexus sp.]
MKRDAVAVCISMLFALSCTSHKKANPKPDLMEEQILARSDFQFSSLRAVPWEATEEGLKGFFSDYRKTYLPEALLSLDLEGCSAFDTEFSFMFRCVKVSFSKDDHTLDLNASVTLSFDLSTQTFGILQNSISYASGLYESRRYNYQDEDRVIGANLLHLSKTFDAWVNDNPKMKVKVFDRPYPEFAAEVGKYFGSEGTTAELKPGISLHLLPDAANAGVGKVKFAAADPEAFIRRNSEGVEMSNTVLGCKDLECLNRGQVYYQLFGSTLSIGSGPLSGFEYGEEFSAIKFKEWPPEK